VETSEQILLSVKKQVLQILPDAEVILFGSRATSTAHDESDWDILVLSNQLVTPALKRILHNTIFPLSVAAGVFINVLLVSQKDWKQNPSYYSLKKSIANNCVFI